MGALLPNGGDPADTSGCHAMQGPGQELPVCVQALGPSVEALLCSHTAGVQGRGKVHSRKTLNLVVPDQGIISRHIGQRALAAR